MTVILTFLPTLTDLGAVNAGGKTEGVTPTIAVATGTEPA